MTTTAHRIADRYLQAAMTRNLDPVPVVLADGGVITTTDITRLMRPHGFTLEGVLLFRVSEDPAGTYRWDAMSDGRLVRGQVELDVHHDPHHVVVTGKLVVLSNRTASQNAVPVTTVPILPVKQRLAVIASMARRAIEDLRTAPEDREHVLAHLTDIVEIAEAQGWAVEP